MLLPHRHCKPEEVAALDPCLSPASQGGGPAQCPPVEAAHDVAMHYHSQLIGVIALGSMLALSAFLRFYQLDSLQSL
jgi:hypothetical protein